MSDDDLSEVIIMFPPKKDATAAILADPSEPEQPKSTQATSSTAQTSATTSEPMLTESAEATSSTAAEELPKEVDEPVTAKSTKAGKTLKPGPKVRLNLSEYIKAHAPDVYYVTVDGFYCRACKSTISYQCILV